MTLLLAVSFLRVQLRGSDPAAVIEHAWQKQPPVRCDALFGTSRFALSIGEHALWYSFTLNPQVLRHAHDDDALRHAVGVEMGEGLRHSRVRVSPDLAAALLNGLDTHGLEARVRAHALQCGGVRATEPGVARVLSDEVLRKALATMGVF